jgi:hypothetical protein
MAAADALALCALLLAQAPEPGALTVEVRPGTLTLGSGARARVVVRSPSGPPRVDASAGTLGLLAETAPGTFEADLEPPAETFPQLAIVAALAGDRIAYAALPLVGRGVAVATTEPRAVITVRIRDREFGPARADELGVAHVQVEVPPGERHAWQRGRALDLRVPPLRQVHVVLARGEARADREEAVDVFALAAAPDGAPWSGAPVELSATAGTLGPLREVAPGAFAATWTLPPGPAGDAAVEAWIGDAPRARARLARVPGPPAHLALRLGRERAVAGDPPVELVAEVADAAGNRVDGDVKLAAAFGTVSGAARRDVGVVSSSYLVPERLEGRAEALVEAALGDLVDRRTLALEPAAPASLSVELVPPELVADGAAAAEVRVLVADRFGNAVDLEAPALSSERGRVEPPERAAPGRWRARYTPERARADGAGAVVARTGPLERRAEVRLGAAPRRLAGTLRAGLLHGAGGFTAPSVGGAVELWPLSLGGAWGAALGVSFARDSSAAAPEVGAERLSLASSLELWPVTLTALAQRRVAPRVRVSAGAGLSLVPIRSVVSLGGDVAADEWGHALGVHATAGAALELPRRHLRVRLDAQVGWQEDPGMRSFRGALTTVGLSLGVSHDAL